jgi:competence protein ComEC
MSVGALRLLFLTVLSLGVGIIWFIVLSAPHTHLTVAFLNVGQGDAILIESPTGNQMLIDGGRDAALLRELPKIMGPTDRSIDLVLATHPDADHIGGLPDIFERYEVGMYMESGNIGDTATFQTLERDVEKEKAPRVIARRGMRIVLGGGAYADVLFPDRDVSRAESNSASAVLRVVYGESEFLLTGDAPISTERTLLSYGVETLTSDVLKAGHHGSRTSSSEGFLKAVNPMYGVFSRGCENSYGHPHVEVVERFNSLGIPTLDTCTDSTIVFSSNGQTLVQKQ